MATPHVSGVAALVWSHHTSKTAKEVRKALTDSAKDLGDPGRDDKYGFGLVQSDEAKRYLGGSVTPAPPTPPPVNSPVSSCTDVPGWADSYGDGCAWYVDADGSNCAEYGGGNAGNNGQTANEACCVCEGGNAPPTTSPPPVNSPESSCTDVPGWADFFGDGCTWYDYGSTSNCDYYGEMEGTNRQTGNEACCVCGGGNNA